MNPSTFVINKVQLVPDMAQNTGGATSNTTASSSTSKGQGSSRYAHLSAPSKEWQEVGFRQDFRSFHVSLTESHFQFHNPEAVPTLIGSPEQLRNLMTTLKSTANASGLATVAEEGLEVKDFPVTTTDGATILCRTYTPTAGSDPYPGLV